MLGNGNSFAIIESHYKNFTMPCIKKKVESFSFEDRIVPLRYMTSVSLSKFTMIWIDHGNIHKRELR